MPLAYRVMRESPVDLIRFGPQRPEPLGYTIPRIDPSLAIKQEFLGIENILHDPGCDAFFFCHTDARVTGLYRRELWPEPSEDPLYQILWHTSTNLLMAAYLDDEDMPAIDDSHDGILDRGYRVAGERETRDARDLDDLARGQLEDASEAVAAMQHPCEWDLLVLAGALRNLGRLDEALKVSEEALSAPDASYRSVLSMARLVWGTDPKRAAKMVALASEMAPDDPMVLWARSDLYRDQGAYSDAAELLDRVLATFDRKLTFEYELVMRRAELAKRLGQADRLDEMLRRFEALGLDAEALQDDLERLINGPLSEDP